MPESARKEISQTRKCPHTLLSAGGAADQGLFHLHDKGRPYLCGRGHLRQRGLPCPCHTPGHQVISLMRRNRDNLPTCNLCCCEIHTEEEGGGWWWTDHFFNPQYLTLNNWICFSEKNLYWNSTGICGWWLELCGYKPNSPSSFFLQFFQKSLRVQERHSPKKPVNHAIARLQKL